MSKERMGFLTNQVNSLMKKKEEMKMKNIPLWNWPNEEGRLIKMYTNEIALLKEQNNKEETEMMDTDKEAELVETFIKRLNKREKEREEEMMNKKKEIDFTKEETKEESKMDRVPTELEMLKGLMGGLNNKEETKMTTDNKKELIAAKGLVVGVNQLTTSNLLGEVESKRLSAIVQEVAAALVAIEKNGKQVDKLKERIVKKLGNETYKVIIKRGGNREVFNKVWKNIENIANQYYLNNKEEKEMIKMDLQFFASKEKEEETNMIIIKGVAFEQGQLEEWVEGLTRKQLNLLTEQEEVEELAGIAVNELWKRIENEMDAYFTKGHREYEDDNYEEWLIENYEFVDEVIELN